VRDFITEAALAGIENGHPLIELYALSIDGSIAATIGGTAAEGRFCAMFNSVAGGNIAQLSPGTLLLLDLVRRCCTRRLAMFDLGVGEADYKKLLCDEVEPLFDSVLPLSAGGRVAAPALRALLRTKRLVKQTPALWSLVRLGRRLRAGLNQT
jgi:CelD/BcsL family acetyltransferase involved in cellulose biosynthesis